MDNVLREKLNQLTSKCEILQKNVLIFLDYRENTFNALILWKK
jgi:hypothetical protein